MLVLLGVSSCVSLLFVGICLCVRLVCIVCMWLSLLMKL